MSKVPEQVKDTVSFVFVETSPGKLQPNGTAFFVSKPIEGQIDRVAVYLVTAKHVLLQSDMQYFPRIFLRLNKHSGGSDVAAVQLTGQGSTPIYTHSDPAIDIAVLPLLPDTGTYNLRTIPENMITTQERFKEVQIAEGDEVFFTGLFTPFLGSQRNYPIVRFGRVALLTDEKVPWQGKLVDIYMVECQAFGGNSGSPVFFYLNPTRQPGTIQLGQPVFLLAGVMMGTFREANQLQIITPSPTPVSFENIGIAAVVPAFYLHEILNSQDLKNSRGGMSKT